MNPNLYLLKCKYVVLLISASLFFNHQLLAQLGNDDPSFITGSGVSNTVSASAIQSNGKIIIAGDFSSYNGTSRSSIARLNQDGTLDASFSTSPAGGPNDAIYALALQSDGKILIGGIFNTYGGISRNSIARLNLDGTLDLSFNPGTGTNFLVTSISLQPNGQIIIAGNFSSYNGTSKNGIARLNSDGSLDLGFSAGTGPNSTINTLSLQSDGKIIAGGFFTTFNGIANKYIVRLNTDGTTDLSFNQGTGLNSYVYSTAIQPDNKIIIGGYFSSYNGVARGRIVRLNFDGSIDLSLNSGMGANGQITTLGIESGGKIIIGGDFTIYNNISRKNIARINSDGTLDTNFDSGSGANFAVNTLSIQSDGKIIIGGDFTTYNGVSRNRVTRITAASVLPLTLISFSVNNEGNKNQLKWKTSNEINTKSFVVQRSNDGNTFTDIGLLNAKGFEESVYNFDDIESKTNVVTYYRLKIVDIDGQSIFSKVVAVKNILELLNIKFITNPFLDNIVIGINSNAKGYVTLSILDNSGKILRKEQRSLEKGFNNLSVNGLASLANGIYLLTLECYGEKLSFKLIK